MWLPQLNSYKQLIVDCLRQPAHPREMDYYYDMGEQLPANHCIIAVASVGDWWIIGFINDRAIRSCHPVSGPVEPEHGPGRPRRQYAYLIQ
jgi:hypothetical protein